MNTVIILKINNYFDGLEDKIDQFCKSFNDFYLPLANGSKVIVIDQNSHSHQKLDYILSRVMNKLTGSFYRADVSDIKPEEKFRRVIIVTNRRAKIRSLYYEILGKVIPSERVRIYLVDEE